MVKGKKVSKVLYILPIFFGWIGGVIGYFVARSQGDQDTANKVFLLGIGITVGIFVLGFGLGVTQDLGIPLSLLT